MFFDLRTVENDVLRFVDLMLRTFDKDLLDLLTYVGICWSASTSTRLYLCVSFGVCPLSAQLWKRAQRSGARLLLITLFSECGSKCFKAE